MSPKDSTSFCEKNDSKHDFPENVETQDKGSCDQIDATPKAESHVLNLLPESIVKASLMSERPESFTKVLLLSSLPIPCERLIGHISSPIYWNRFLERDGHVDINVSAWTPGL
jgi:hypothetical protein